MTEPDLEAQIVGELYIAVEGFGADPDLLSIIGSWRGALDDAEVLLLLQDYNATWKALHRSR